MSIVESQDWEKATSYAITDEDIERGRLLLGVDVANAHREYLQTATEDSIRNFAYGSGNDNPLYCDPDYARTTRWGGVVAPGMMAGIVNKPMKGDPMPEDIKARTRSLFKGIHVFVSGSDWSWYRPIYPGDTVYSYSGQESLEVKQSEFAGRSVIRVNRHVKLNQRAEVIATYKVLMVLTERKTAREKGKYSRIEPAKYTDAEIAAIDAVYEQEQVRGSTPRYWEDVSIGESLGKMAKGPLTVTDIMCFHAGGYGFYPYSPCVGRLAYQNRRRIPAFYIKNEQGVPDVAQRLHWDPAWAQAIGNPMAYDYGVMRENYLYHYLTDWCGDDGVVVSQHDEVRKFNYIGDTQFITGEVTAKQQEEGRCHVDVSVRMHSQRDQETVTAIARIALPSREHGPARWLQVPAQLEQQALSFMSRHWQLVGAK